MEQTKEFSLTLDDRPGTLAKATDAIAKAGINIEGYCAVPSGSNGKGTFRVVTKDPANTRKALEAAGFKVQDERDAAIIDVEDRPGVVAQIFRRLAENELNVGPTFNSFSASLRKIWATVPGRSSTSIIAASRSSCTLNPAASSALRVLAGSLVTTRKVPFPFVPEGTAQ